MDERQDFTLILKSRFPIVLLETHEESRATSLLENICNFEEWAFFTWSVTEGIHRYGRSDRIPMTQDFTAALRHIDQTLQNGVYALLDAHPYLDNPVNQRLLREIALGYNKTARTLVFVSSAIEMPPELARMSARFRLSVLDAAGVREVIREEAKLYESREGRKPRGTQEAVDLLAQHLAGMCRDDARRLVRQAIVEDGEIDQKDIARILRFKHDSLGKGGVLSFEPDIAKFQAAGLNHLLAVRAPGPKTGVPRCCRCERAGHAQRHPAARRAGRRKEPGRQGGRGRLGHSLAVPGFRHAVQQVLR